MILTACGTGSDTSRVAVPAAPEVHVEICPPYCGEPEPTTTTEAPTTTTVAPAPEPEPIPHDAGARSYAWWEAIATCESGNTNAWRTGYYGLEASSPVGGLSKAEQLAWAESIYAEHGDAAWGCSSVAWQMVPGG